MPDAKITALPAASALAGTELVEIVQASENRQTTVADLSSGKQPLDATLTALAGVTVAANQVIYATGTDAFTATGLTAAGRALIDDADAAAQRVTLGVEKWSAMIEIDGPVAGTAYTILPKHDQALVVTAVVQQSAGASAGTINIRDDGTSIAGLGSVAVSTTESTTAPTSGSQTIAANSKVDVVPSGITGVTRLTITLRGTK